MPKAIPLYQVDAFTAERFHGNPAAVCILDNESSALVSDSTKSKIASEMNLSETAFLEPAGSGVKGRFSLRWFTPTVEVDLCGHATVASAAALLEGEGLQAEELSFETRSGVLTVKRSEEGQYHVTVPSLPPVDALPGTSEDRNVILEAVMGPSNLGLAEGMHYCAQLRYMMVVCREGTTQEQLESLAPDYRTLKERTLSCAVLGVLVTAVGGSGGAHDLLLRFFAPAAGIEEDPVTGSAYAVAGPFWAQRLDRRQLRARQCSPRGGDITVTAEVKPGRVDVAGHAVIVFKGVLYLD